MVARSNTQYFGVNVYVIQFENLIGNLISEIEGISWILEYKVWNSKWNMK